MRLHRGLLLAVLLLPAPALADMAKPPHAEARPVTSVHHGETLTDPYAWLRAADWQDVIDDPTKLPADIRAYLEAENAYAATELAGSKELEDKIFGEIMGRTKQDEESVPLPDGPFVYYERGVVGKDHDLILRRPRAGGPEEVLLDENALAEGRSFFSLAGSDHSPDHKLLAYATDTEGSERYTIRIRDLATGKDLADTITSTDGGIGWAPDGRSLYYVAVDETIRAHAVLQHVLGTPQSADRLIYEEKDGGYLVDADVTRDMSLLVIGAGNTTTRELRILDLRVPDAEPVVLLPRKTGERSFVTHAAGKLYILTNTDGAEDFKVLSAEDGHYERVAWTEIVSTEPGRPITGIMAFSGHLVREEQHQGLDRIVVRRISDGFEHSIAFQEEAYELGTIGGFETDTREILFEYSSMTTPAEVYAYDMETRERRLIKRQQVPSGHDPSAYVTRRLLAPTADGERVPITLLYARSTKLDGTAPAVIEGYGAYGSSTPASFDTTKLSLVDRGFVYALAHVRGGLEGGERWYRLGREANKLNTMRDFIACAKFLKDGRLVDSGRLIGYGASAGGILIGAVANMEPELLHGLVADVPFVDVLNTMLDDTLPLTPNEFPEWGNPITDKAAFDTIRAYAPYENVHRAAYPHMLVLSSLSDTRVTYWEPAKWVARLRANAIGNHLLLLETEMNAGHGGVSGQIQAIHRWARIYAAMALFAQTP